MSPPRDASERDPADRRGGQDTVWPWSGGLLPLALMVLALLGSVVIPARQTLEITRLLRETTEVLAPARVTSAQLQTGLSEEMGAMQGYALSGERASLRRHEALASDNDRRLATLDSLGGRLGGSFKGRVATVRDRTNAWRTAVHGWTTRPGDRLALASALREGRARHEALMTAVAELSAELATDAAVRDARLNELEHFSLTSNVAMVSGAFVALYAVLLLTLRTRRLAASLRQRADAESARARREASLRAVAEALADAVTIDEVTERIVRAALESLGGRGAFVQRIATGPPDSAAVLTVTAVAGTGVPPLGTTCPLVGSNAERVFATGGPVLIPATDVGTGTGDPDALDDPAAPTIAIPLGSATAPVGMLSVLSATGHFRAEDAEGASVFGHLAALAYARVMLLEEAIEGGQRLQRVMTSRSRLMRGFSHDVKNPIGAADGYAELLSEGIYGELNPEQCESIARIRRCMRSALTLIDDLHELGRAETGHLDISTEPVDIAELVRNLGEEFQATAKAGGLQLVVRADPDVPLVQTSRIRVRQIASNLLSNAIKYTDAGTVTVRVTQRATGQDTERGAWVLIEVADTGRGVAPDKLDFIFQEFGRVAGSEKEGAGLGLAISRLLAQALGGRIDVASESGRGSTFTLWIPLAPRAAG